MWLVGGEGGEGGGLSQGCGFLLLRLRWGKRDTGVHTNTHTHTHVCGCVCVCIWATLLQPLPEGEVGHDTGVLDTHVGNRVGGVVVVVVVGLSRGPRG